MSLCVGYIVGLAISWALCHCGLVILADSLVFEHNRQTCDAQINTLVLICRLYKLNTNNCYNRKCKSPVDKGKNHHEWVGWGNQPPFVSRYHSVHSDKQVYKAGPESIHIATSLTWPICILKANIMGRATGQQNISTINFKQWTSYSMATLMWTAGVQQQQKCWLYCILSMELVYGGKL